MTDERAEVSSASGEPSSLSRPSRNFDFSRCAVAGETNGAFDFFELELLRLVGTELEFFILS
jgi:hypothetical protein